MNVGPKLKALAASVLFAGVSLGVAPASATDPVFEVTITNLTYQQVFSPIVVASHRRGVRLFTPGEEASPELIAVAEDGAPGPLSDALADDPRVRDVQDSGGPLPPGQSVTVYVSARGAREISLASMLVNTNDAFVALNGVTAPRRYQTLSFRMPAYDAGSEPNDELCDNIPGPACAGFAQEGLSPDAGGEDFVHIHRGIHGVGDLDEATYDWRNPVADIVIRRIR